MGRHRTVSGFIGVIGFIESHRLCISLKLFDDPVCVFGVIFSDKSLDAGRIKNGHICFGRINSLTDGFSGINEIVKHSLQVIKKVLFESGNFRGIRDFGKTTEFS